MQFAQIIYVSLHLSNLSQPKQNINPPVNKVIDTHHKQAVVPHALLAKLSVNIPQWLHYDPSVLLFLFTLLLLLVLVLLLTTLMWIGWGWVGSEGGRTWLLKTGAMFVVEFCYFGAPNLYPHEVQNWALSLFLFPH